MTITIFLGVENDGIVKSSIDDIEGSNWCYENCINKPSLTIDIVWEKVACFCLELAWFTEIIVIFLQREEIDMESRHCCIIVIDRIIVY